MTHRKIRTVRSKATTEDAVFGYRAPSSGRRMMANSDDDSDRDVDDDLLTDDGSRVRSESRSVVITVADLRKVVREVMTGTHSVVRR